jgi:hypothetical protein
MHISSISANTITSSSKSPNIIKKKILTKHNIKVGTVIEKGRLQMSLETR